MKTTNEDRTTRDTKIDTNAAAERAKARIRGISLAAKVATVGGLAVAGLALVEARASAGGPAGRSAAADAIATAAAADDAPRALDEGLFKVSKGCGCSPCWGPPAPPSRTLRGKRRRSGAARARRSRANRGDR